MYYNKGNVTKKMVNWDFFWNMIFSLHQYPEEFQYDSNTVE